MKLLFCLLIKGKDLSFEACYTLEFEPNPFGGLGKLAYHGQFHVEYILDFVFAKKAQKFATKEYILKISS